MEHQNLIIDSDSIAKKITRVAYQIMEEHCLEKEIHLIGIQQGGVVLSSLLKKELDKIGFAIEVYEHQLSIDKKDPVSGAMKMSFDVAKMEDKCVVIVDDVCNSGKTIFYAYKPLMNIKVKSLKIAVLVDRKHKRFPVHCDYVGTSLSTTLQEHINVKIENNQLIGAFLS